MAAGQTIKASFGMDVGPLRAAAREAAIIGRKIKKDMQAVLSFSLKLPAKALIGSLNAVAAGVKMLGAAAVIAGAGLAVGVHHAYDLGRELTELSDRTGIAAGKLAILRQAFEDAGESADDVGPAINKMQRFLENAAQGGIKASETFAGLGLSVAQLQAMTPDQQFLAIGNAIESIQDPALRAADAMAIFGRSGGQFLALFGSEGIYQRAATTLGGQAKLLSENAAIFSQIAVSLSHVGVKLQGFFVGVASRLAVVLVPLLDKFEQLDLSGVGEKFGAGLIRGAEFVVGAFKNPKAFIGVATDALMYGVLTAGNVLLAALKTAKNYFQDGMLETIQGIGDVLLAVLTKAFAVPMAYFQGQIEDLLSRIPGQPEYQQRKRAEADVATHTQAAGQMRDLARQAAAAETAANKRGDDKEGEHQGMLFNYYLNAADEERKAAWQAHLAVGTPQERAQAILAGGGPQIATARGNMTADQLLAQGTAELQSGLSKAGEKIAASSYEDVLGAGKYGAAMRAGFTDVANQGAKAIAPALTPQPMLNGKPVSAAYAAQLAATVGHAKANQILYSPAQAALMNQAAAPKVSPAYYAQLVGMYGAKAAANMITSTGALASAAAGAATAGAATGPTYRGKFGRWNGAFSDDALTTSFDKDRVRLGLHEGLSGGAYHLIRRGDAARAKAAEMAAKKQQKEPMGIADESVKKLAKAIGTELEVKQ